jgi:ABC-type transport system substrate-binding protein
MDKMNYAGYSDKKSDILLEDARMITDSTVRNAKYDQFYETIKNESMATYYDPVTYIFSISESIKGIDSFERCDGDSKYLGFSKWYLKTKRVSK